MKKSAIILALVAAIGLSACSSTGTKEADVMPTKSVITDFTDDGIQITYTTSGKLEKIEVYGQAFTNRGDFQTLAEANAKAKLVKFVHGEQVNSNKYVRVLTKSMEKAQEKATDYRGTAVNTTDKEFESGNDGAGQDEDNVTRQLALRLNATITNNVTTIVAGGRLTGVRKVRDEFKKDGAIYVAVYTWSERDQKTSEQVRNLMR